MAAAAGAAVAAGLFLWSRRAQISDRVGDLAEGVAGTVEDAEQGSSPATGQSRSGEEVIGTSPPRRRGRRSQAEIAQEALTLKQIGEHA